MILKIFSLQKNREIPERHNDIKQVCGNIKQVFLFKYGDNKYYCLFQEKN